MWAVFNDGNKTLLHQPRGVDVGGPDRGALRANIAETLLASLITEQGGKDIQHEEHKDILFGPGRRAQW
jgi:hypothetical protein